MKDQANLKPAIAHLISEYMQSNQSYTYRQFLNHLKYQVVVLSRFYFKGSKKLFPVDELHYLTNIGRIYAFTEKIRPALIDWLFEQLIKYWVKKRGVKLLHFHFGTLGAKFCYLRENLNIPFVISFYGADTTSYPLKSDWKPLYEVMFKTADAFIALSETPRQQLIALGASPEKCFIVHGSVDTDSFSYVKRKASPAVKFLITGRFIEKKGHLILLDSFRQLIDSGRKAKLTIIGFGELKERILEKINKLDISGQVEVVDTTTIPDYFSFVIPKYQEADVFVLPSIVASDNDQEGTPLVILEASAVGLPVISTNVAGIPEVLKDGVTGYVIPQKDPQTLFEKMAHLYDHPEIRTQFGLEGRKFIEENFSLSSLPSRLDRVYSQLLK